MNSQGLNIHYNSIIQHSYNTLPKVKVSKSQKSSRPRTIGEIFKTIRIESPCRLVPSNYVRPRLRGRTNNPVFPVTLCLRSLKTTTTATEEGNRPRRGSNHGTSWCVDGQFIVFLGSARVARSHGPRETMNFYNEYSGEKFFNRAFSSRAFIHANAQARCPEITYSCECVSLAP